MCVSASQASFSDTILYAAEMCRAGEIVHVMGYQNAVENRVIGANAMILPIPSFDDMGPENLIDTKPFSNVLRDLVSGLQPRSRSMSKGAGGGYKIFNSGDYTVVLTADARTIREALGQVDESRRPHIRDDLLAFYAQRYAGWHIAVCCFNNQSMPTPDPLLWWYRPMNPDVLFAPGVDSHSGGPPDLTRDVRRDHAVVFGSAQSKTGAIGSRLEKLPDNHRWMFEGRYSLTTIKHATPNADFVLPVEVARSGRHVSWRDMVE